ncbi:MAG: hypothetical protein HY561_01470 [Gemmatimonadetes bacterium]|nr:hypothetical protein [Gemmatimonadota bacterium]
MGYYIRYPLRHRIPTVLVRLVTDDGEVSFRARWKQSAKDLHHRILFRLRHGWPLWFEDEWGRDLVFKSERVWGALVDGRR